MTQSIRLSQRAALMPASPIRRLAPLAAAARKAGKSIYALNIGQPDIPTPRPILDRLRSYDAANVAYGPSQGLPAVKTLGHWAVPFDSQLLAAIGTMGLRHNLSS